MGKEVISSEFKKCLEKAKIVRFEKGPMLSMKELNAANDDVLSSKDTFKRENYKWATIQAYYSMFHTARALIYAQKYREKSHYENAAECPALWAGMNAAVQSSIGRTFLSC
jgi:hypothetical protein